MESTPVGKFLEISQIKSNEDDKTRELQNGDAHSHPDFDSLELIEKCVSSENEKKVLPQDLRMLPQAY